ncbi:MAG TPA: hypothetical protein VF476_16820 [Chitinophagaceae bacterium]
MINKPITKAASLTLFVLLLSGFVAYRSGFLDHYFPSNNDRPVFTENSTDIGLSDTTIKPQKDRAILPSSKVGIIRESSKKNLSKQEADSIIKKAADNITHKTKEDVQKKADTFQRKEMMYSSKSMMVIDPYQIIFLDSVKKQMRLIEKKNKKQKQ